MRDAKMDFLSLTYNRQLRAARVLLGWEQTELADASGVALGTIRRMEALEGPIRCNTTTLHKVQGALEKAGIEFLNHGNPGVRLKITPRPS
jgi:predicted transcriptional regulator